MNKYIIETKNLTKKYHNFHAIDNITLNIPKGEIFGLIGQNGAGKSTLMKVLSGMIHETSGTYRLFEHTPQEDKYVYHRVGALIEQPGLIGSMNAYDNMKVKALAMGCFNHNEIMELLQLCGIANTGKKKVKSFSLGMRQRLAIAITLIGDPDLLILDEPTNGMDPQGLNEMRDLFVHLNKDRNKTILISSHILEELSKIATSYGIIKDGKLVECISHEELELRSQDYLLLKVDDPKLATVLLEEKLAIKDYQIVDAQTIHIFNFHDSAKVITTLVMNNTKVYECAQHQQSLEHYFLSINGGDSNVEHVEK